jgi:hypothetical protein
MFKASKGNFETWFARSDETILEIKYLVVIRLKETEKADSEDI